MIHRGGITALQAKGSFMIDWKLIHQLQKDFYYHYAIFSEMKVFVIPFCWSESMDQFSTIFHNPSLTQTTSEFAFCIFQTCSTTL